MYCWRLDTCEGCGCLAETGKMKHKCGRCVERNRQFTVNPQPAEGWGLHARYCSVECQTGDWEHHRTECQTPGQFLDFIAARTTHTTASGMPIGRQSTPPLTEAENKAVEQATAELMDTADFATMARTYGREAAMNRVTTSASQMISDARFIREQENPLEALLDRFRSDVDAMMRWHGITEPSSVAALLSCLTQHFDSLLNEVGNDANDAFANPINIERT